MKIVFKIVLLFFMVGIFQLSNYLQAQITYGIKMDTNMLLIGDQTNITLEASFPDSIVVSLPVFSDTIIDKLEILDISDIDTILENNIYKISQKYLVTCFDSGWYEIPSANFMIGFASANYIDTVQSNPLYFGVMSMSLDTVNTDAITDIKNPIGAPITFKEILPFAGIGFGVLLLIFLIYIFYLKFAKKESIFVKKAIPKEAAHLIAFRSLDSLKDEKLWQQGRVKEYYSKLTEAVRVYIEDRYEIPAMESTTDEIIEAFKGDDFIDKELKSKLFDTLTSADFVKFAKATPLPDENERSLDFAYQFVTKTKVVEVVPEEEDGDQSLVSSLQSTVGSQ